MARFFAEQETSWQRGLETLAEQQARVTQHNPTGDNAEAEKVLAELHSDIERILNPPAPTPPV